MEVQTYETRKENNNSKIWTLQSEWKCGRWISDPRKLILSWQWVKQRGNPLYTAEPQGSEIGPR